MWRRQAGNFSPYCKNTLTACLYYRSNRTELICFNSICTSDKKFLEKNGVIRTATKGQKQGGDLQRNAVTSLVRFAVQLHKVD